MRHNVSSSFHACFHPAKVSKTSARLLECWSQALQGRDYFLEGEPCNGRMVSCSAPPKRLTSALSLSISLLPAVVIPQASGDHTRAPLSLSVLCHRVILSLYLGCTLVLFTR